MFLRRAKGEFEELPELATKKTTPPITKHAAISFQGLPFDLGVAGGVKAADAKGDFGLGAFGVIIKYGLANMVL